MYKVVRTSRLYEQIVQQIEESIIKGTLKAGDQLPSERELALKFGVSRTAVREAVKALHEKGLVEAYSGRGTFITNGTSQAVRQSHRPDDADRSARTARRIWLKCGRFSSLKLPRWRRHAFRSRNSR